MALGPNAPPNVTSAKEAAEKTAPSIRERRFLEQVSGSNLRLFSVRSQKKSIGVTKNRACLCVHGMRKMQKQAGPADSCG